MARLTALPSLEIIRGLKGILDFYLWKGLPCVRAWPKYRPAKQTAASLAAALIFGAIVKSYGLLGDLPLEAYRDDALDQTRTARDIMVTGAYGNLHEASMSEFLDALIVSRDALVLLTTLVNALHSVGTDDLDVHVLASVLPAGAATAAAQGTQLTALQKLDDLQDALQSKHLDRLLVRGMDQLFTYKAQVSGKYTHTKSGPGTYTLLGAAVDPDEIWVLTTLMAYNWNTAMTALYLGYRKDEVDYWGAGTGAIPIKAAWNTFTPMLLVEGDQPAGFFSGCADGDPLALFYNGYSMTLET